MTPTRIRRRAQEFDSVDRWSRCPPTRQFFVSVDSKILRVSVSHSFSTLTRHITNVDSKGFAWAERDPFPPGQKYDLMRPPLITKGYCIGRIIKGQEKAGVYGRRGELGDGI